MINIAVIFRRSIDSYQISSMNEIKHMRDVLTEEDFMEDEGRLRRMKVI